MKKLIATAAAAALLALWPAVAPAQIGGLPDLVYSSTCFGLGNTNSENGYTNTFNYIDCSKGKTVALEVAFTGTSTGTGAFWVVHVPSFDKTAPATYANGATAVTNRIKIEQNTTTKVIAHTNVANVLSPYLAVRLEMTNAIGVLSNLTVKAYVKP